MSLCIEEYAVRKCVAAGLPIVVCAEAEADDYDWDVADEFSGTGRTVCPLPLPEQKESECLWVNRIRSSAYQTEKQKRGLVRHYAPSHIWHFCNNILT